MIHAAALIAAAVLQTQHAQRQVTLDDLSFLVGTWRGGEGGSRYEEAWLPPMAGNMSAIFRTGSEDSVRLLEILTFAEVDGGVVYRLRHFDAALTPWASEADGPSEGTVTLIDSDSIRCDMTRPGGATAVTYDRDGDTLTAKVIFAEDSGRQPIVLEFELVQ